MYNAYSAVQEVYINQKALFFLYLLPKIFLIFTGAVNGYIMNLAICDIFHQPSEKRLALQYFIVSTTVLFSGINDARVLLQYIARDMMRDLRYLKRGLNALICKKYGPYQLMGEGVTRNDMLRQLKNDFDDLNIILTLILSDTEIEGYKHLILKQDWIERTRSTEFNFYLRIMSKPFPMCRFIGSDVGGSVISVILAYFGNHNTYEYTRKALSSLISYWFAVSNKNLFSNIISNLAAVIASVTGSMVSFFLIRDLFFRDVFKVVSRADLKKRFPLLLLSFVPALSFGLLNIIVTVMNKSLSSFEKIIVSCSGVISATVVTRYGIEGGIEQLRNKPRFRQELLKINYKISDFFDSLPEYQLKQMSDRINVIKKQGETNTNDRIHP